MINFLLSFILLISGYYGHSLTFFCLALYHFNETIIQTLTIYHLPQFLHSLFSWLLSITFGYLSLYLGYYTLLTFFSSYIPTLFISIGTIIVITIQELMFWYFRYNAQKRQSQSLFYDGYHYRKNSCLTLLCLILSPVPFFSSFISLSLCISIFKTTLIFFYHSIPF